MESISDNVCTVAVFVNETSERIRSIHGLTKLSMCNYIETNPPVFRRAAGTLYKGIENFR